MRHNLLLSLTLTASVGAAALFTGCSSEPLLPSKSEEYSREFIKNFGIFDQSHDWNHATQTTVNVTTATPTDIKVCAKFDGKLYSFAEYKNVNGQQTLNVDIPKGTTDLIIRANGKNYAVKAGGEVRIGSRGSRIVWEHGQDGKGKFNVEITENRIFRTPEEVLRYREFLPEENYNVGKVTQDFMFESRGPFLIYPAYYQTDRFLSNIIGVYYYDDNNKIVTQDFFRLGDGKLMTYTSQESDTEGDIKLYWHELIEGNNNYIEVPSKATRFVDFTDEDWEFLREEFRNGRRYFDGNNDFKIFTEFSHELVDNDVIIHGKYKKYSTVYSSNQSIPKDAVTLSFQAIKIDIPKGQKFGMYIKLDNKMGQPDWGIDPNYTYFFSESEHNTDYLWGPKPGFEDKVLSKSDADDSNSIYYGKDSDNPTPAIHAASFIREEDGMIRLCFEDWYNGSGFASDFDLNDMVFYIAGEVSTTERPDIVPDDPEEPEPETWEWIIACEDLGTNDFDFNDVVFSVSAPVTAADGAETKTVTVKALAAGGILPVYLWYEGVELKPEGSEDGEFHTWFGSTSGNIINAQSGYLEGKSVQIEVKADFTMSCCHTVVFPENNKGNMGGFQVRVVHSETKEVIDANNPNLSDDIGKAPQMICVPMTWRWPKENIHITTVYSKFSDWCANPNLNHDWHENPTGSYFPRPTR